MKRIISAFLVLGVILMFVTAFTWEGELDPNEFDKWELVSVIPSQNGLSWITVKNPNPEHAIDTVALLADLNSNLLGYRYFKGGEPYGYLFDTEQEKYVRYEYTPEERKGCMGCHSDKVNRTI